MISEPQIHIALNLPEECETLLRQALTHKHDDVTELECNERLEFLGDAVLGLIVTEEFFRNHPKAREGLLSRARAAVVSRPSLADSARKIGLHNLILTSSMERKHGITQGQRVLADAMEAVIAAVYMSLGYDTTKAFILQHFGDIMDHALESAVSLDHKTALQEYAHLKLSVTPTYELLTAFGPDHSRNFTFQACVGDIPLSIGTGNSKKSAQQDAAQSSLVMLKRMVSAQKTGVVSVQPETIQFRPDYENTADYMNIATMFNLPQPVTISELDCKGNINTESFLVVAADTRYIMQKVNPGVFPLPHRVMRNLLSVCHHHAQQPGNMPKNWKCLQLQPTKQGAPYLQIMHADSSSVWRMMHFIEGTCSFKQLSDVGDAQRTLKIATEAGKGLATFVQLTQGLPLDHFYASFPGYRNTQLYIDQLEAVWDGCLTVEDAQKHLPEEPYLRTAVWPQYVLHCDTEQYNCRKAATEVVELRDYLLENRHVVMKLWDEVQSGNLKTSIIHGDPKLENFLFDKQTDQVVSMIDLDTLMPYTWLADWGDMARSLVNPMGEKTTDIDSVYLDVSVFKALMQGYVASAHTIPPYELELMTLAPAVIAMELGMRFLTDYIRGDNYFGLTEQDIEQGVTNLSRARVQLRLAQLVLEAQDELQDALHQFLDMTTIAEE